LGWVSFLNPTYGSKKKSTRLAAGKREKEKKGKKGKKGKRVTESSRIRRLPENRYWGSGWRGGSWCSESRNGS